MRERGALLLRAWHSPGAPIPTCAHASPRPPRPPPDYSVEGVAWPAQYFNAATVLACTEVDRATGVFSDCIGATGGPPPQLASASATAAAARGASASAALGGGGGSTSSASAQAAPALALALAATAAAWQWRGW